MSKKKLSNRLLVVAATVLVLAACKKDSNSSSNNTSDYNDNTSEDVSVIEVRNLGSGNIATVKAVVWWYNDNTNESTEVTLASCPYQNGGFKLTLPSSFPNDCMYEWVENEWEEKRDEIIVSDPKAKVGAIGGDGAILVAYSSAERYYIGWFYMYGENSKMGVWADYIYADRNFTAKGKYSGGYYTNQIYKSYNVEYNCSFKKGWNIYYFCYGEYGNNENYVYTTQKPSGVDMKWGYEQESDPIVRFKKENPSTNCTWIGLKKYNENGHYTIEASHYFGSSKDMTEYWWFYAEDYFDVVYSNSNSNNSSDFWQNHIPTAITHRRFSENKAYTVVCSDDGNGNPIFRIDEDGQKSLSPNSKNRINKLKHKSR